MSLDFDCSTLTGCLAGCDQQALLAGGQAVFSCDAIFNLNPQCYGELETGLCTLETNIFRTPDNNPFGALCDACYDSATPSCLAPSLCVDGDITNNDCVKVTSTSESGALGCGACYSASSSQPLKDAWAAYACQDSDLYTIEEQEADAARADLEAKCLASKGCMDNCNEATGQLAYGSALLGCDFTFASNPQCYSVYPDSNCTAETNAWPEPSGSFCDACYAVGPAGAGLCFFDDACDESTGELADACRQGDDAGNSALDCAPCFAPLGIALPTNCANTTELPPTAAPTDAPTDAVTTAPTDAVTTAPTDEETSAGSRLAPALLLASSVLAYIL